MIAVGTTSTRTLESAADENGYLRETSGWTEIFIYPGYQFKVIDGLITNFHLPESTLVMLVSALAGREHVLNAYAEAVAPLPFLQFWRRHVPDRSAHKVMPDVAKSDKIRTANNEWTLREPLLCQPARGAGYGEEETQTAGFGMSR